MKPHYNPDRKCCIPQQTENRLHQHHLFTLDLPPMHHDLLLLNLTSALSHTLILVLIGLSISQVKVLLMTNGSSLINTAKKKR